MSTPPIADIPMLQAARQHLTQSPASPGLSHRVGIHVDPVHACLWMGPEGLKLTSTSSIGQLQANRCINLSLGSSSAIRVTEPETIVVVRLSTASRRTARAGFAVQTHGVNKFCDAYTLDQSVEAAPNGTHNGRAAVSLYFAVPAASEADLLITSFYASRGTHSVLIARGPDHGPSQIVPKSLNPGLKYDKPSQVAFLASKRCRKHTSCESPVSFPLIVVVVGFQQSELLQGTDGNLHSKYGATLALPKFHRRSSNTLRQDKLPFINCLVASINAFDDGQTQLQAPSPTLVLDHELRDHFTLSPCTLVKTSLELFESHSEMHGQRYFFHKASKFAVGKLSTSSLTSPHLWSCAAVITPWRSFISATLFSPSWLSRSYKSRRGAKRTLPDSLVVCLLRALKGYSILVWAIRRTKLTLRLLSRLNADRAVTSSFYYATLRGLLLSVHIRYGPMTMGTGGITYSAHADYRRGARRLQRRVGVVQASLDLATVAD
ncbi:hypothetical protein BC835DRAFT_1304430 [Cytidiella melzeri]|nr:hypothetical protein BC835DRAFT_1304430 [Cytidiella melzeri]